MRARSIVGTRLPPDRVFSILLSRTKRALSVPMFAMQLEKRKGGAALVAHTPPSCLFRYPFLGRLRKRNFPRSASFVIATNLAVLGGCDAPARISRNLGSGEVIAVYGLEGRWAGPVVPDDASCGKPGTGLMSIGRGTFAFDPFQGTTVIKGRVEGDHLSGSFSRPGGNKVSLSISFEGHASASAADEDTIDGKLVSARCRWSVSLKRA